MQCILYGVTNYSIRGKRELPNLTARLASQPKGRRKLIPMHCHLPTRHPISVSVHVCCKNQNHTLFAESVWGRSRRTPPTLRRHATLLHRNLHFTYINLSSGSHGWCHSYLSPMLQCLCMQCILMIALPIWVKRFAFSMNTWEDSLSNPSMKTLSWALQSAREKKYLPLNISQIIILLIKVW